MLIKKIYIYIVSLVLLSSVSGDEAKTSLAFVIDNTISMSTEKKQILARTKDVFDAVLNSNVSQIDEFIIVSFNDPSSNKNITAATLEIKTKNHDDFHTALNEIKSGGGYDCPGMAMTGIQLALDESKPNSLLYVFTDGSAKDYLKYENVKSLAQQKSIQVTFLLTGKCPDKKEELHTVYDHLAAVTSGQVFNIEEQEISKIIEYILVNVRSKRTVLLQKTYKDYECKNNYTFTVDSKIWDIVISKSAHRELLLNDLAVFGPGGKVEVKDLIQTRNTSIAKIKGAKGDYSVHIKDCHDVTMIVSASTSVSFQHGFSSYKPSFLDETSRKPNANTKSHLVISLDNKERDVTLKTVKLRNMKDVFVKELSLKLIDEYQQFYITDLFIPPKVPFKIVVNGFSNSNENITRVSSTTIEYYRIQVEPKKTAASVIILATKEIVADYDKPLILKCKIHGFPRPRITWENEYNATVKSFTVNQIAPYEYISTLKLNNVIENKTYICKAKNFILDSDYVTVKTKVKFNVMQYPKDVAVEYGKSVKVIFKIDAIPPATLNWYRGDELIDNNDDMEIIISLDGSSLKIKNAQPRLAGKYYVEAISTFNYVKREFDVTVTGAEVPKIDKRISKYTKDRESSVDILCKVIQGKPEPVILWSFDRESVGKFRKLKETGETVHIDHVRLEHVGTYKCEVTNEIGMDDHNMQLFIEYRPTVEIRPKRKHNSKNGEKVKLKCLVDGSPTPDVRWFRGDDEIKSGEKYKIYRDHTLSFTGAIEDSGSYTCEVSNSLDTKRSSVSVLIYEPAKIEIPKVGVFQAELQSTLILPCRVSGYPTPKVQWLFYRFGHNMRVPIKLNCDESNNLTLKYIQLQDEGYYVCTADNKVHQDKFTYTVTVPVPANIIPECGSRNIHVVEGDLLFKLKCSSLGSPKPTITWMFNRLPITGSRGYEILNDGTLIVHNVSLKSNGTYICIAKNVYRNDSMEYEVVVHPYPPKQDNPEKILLSEGKKIYKMYCGMKSKKGDLVRWFKDDKLIGTADNQILVNVTKNDAGYYICRFSTSENSYSFHKIISVRKEPKFLKEVNFTLIFKEGEEAIFNCSASGKPTSTILGYTPTDEKITSVASTTVEYQNPTMNVGKVKNMAPKVTVISEDFNKNLTLYCKVVGYPKPDISWQDTTGAYLPSTVNAVELPYEYESILHLAKVEDNVTVTCKANNSIGQDSDSVNIEIKDFFNVIEYPSEPPRIDKNVTDYHVENGSSVDLSCRVIGGKPEPEFYWAVDQSFTNTFKALSHFFKRGSRKNEDIYHIDSVDPKDSGVYRCITRNEIGEAVQDIYLFVEYPPVVVMDDEDILFKEGETIQIPCSVNGVPTPSVRWLVDGLEIVVTNKYKIYSDNTLSFRSTINDEGVYTCEASNPLGKSHRDVRLDIVVPVKIESPKQRILDLHVGYPLILPCQADGYPEPYVKWVFFSKDPNIVPRTLQNDDKNSVVIDKVQLHDEGLYTCVASNFDSMAYIIYEVNVKEPPTIVNSLEDKVINVVKGDLVLRIPCKVVGRPNPTVSWTFKNGLSAITDTELYDVDKDGTLIISNLDENDTGSYICTAANPLGVAVKKYNVVVSGPPTIVNSSEDQIINAVKGDLVLRIPCKVVGTPNPTVSWTFQNSLNAVTGTKLYDVDKDGTLIISNLDEKDTGSYICRAENPLGVAVKKYNVVVSGPPTIVNSSEDQIINAVKGDLVLRIPCKVVGTPNPTVSWTFQNSLNAVTGTKLYDVDKDGTLIISNLEEKDTGSYICRAENPLGVAVKKYNVVVSGPPTIVNSSEDQIINAVKGDLVLRIPCKVVGTPNPTVSWTFQNSLNAVTGTKLYDVDKDGTLIISNLEEKDTGSYICRAENPLGVAVKKYNVVVSGPPTIVNSSEDQIINAVKGDLVLRIPCKVVGTPNPTVSWTFQNSLNAVTGTKLYDVDEDGTLVISNLEEKDTGSYICRAENPLGVAVKKYNVVVSDSPTPDNNTLTVLIEEGSLLKIDCGLSHMKSDRIRWFKDGRFINDGELVINKAKATDSGIYSCHVSNFQHSHSSHNNVTVGYKPTFASDEETSIVLSEGSLTALSCKAVGHPNPKVNWWKKSQRIEETSTVLILYKETSDIGNYTCAVSNEFGTISRNFNVINAKECVLNIYNNFKMQQPLLLLSEELSSQALQGAKGKFWIPASHSILMICPNTFININGINYGDNLNGSCVDGSIFDINGRYVNFSNIRCNDKIVPLTKKTGISCGPGNTELLNIGYTVGVEFMGIYDVCIEKGHKFPLYAKHYLYPMAAKTVPSEPIDFMKSKRLPFEFEDMYNCEQQRNSILSLTGKRLSTNNRCCFAKRQLVSPRDVMTGYQQVATYNYLNVIPKWGTCGTENWDDLEEIVRNQVKELDHPLEVYTGSSHFMKLPAQHKESTVYLIDRFDRKQPIPRYIWKVIINHYKGDAVAIIQINIPDITIYQAFSFMLCKDICHEIEWMKNTKWRDVKKGFTFCCNIKEFEKKFGYKDIFKIHELSTKALII